MRSRGKSMKAKLEKLGLGALMVALTGLTLWMGLYALITFPHLPHHNPGRPHHARSK
jgi:hypothetical protein